VHVDFEDGRFSFRVVNRSAEHEPTLAHEAE
jgi:hypothetical protein